MIVVTCELWSARTGKRRVLGRAVIANTGEGDLQTGSYEVKIGRQQPGDKIELPVFANSIELAFIRKVVDKPQRRATVVEFPRLRLNVWHLLCRGLQAAGYGTKEQS